jgi:hypothetical protein
LHKDNTAWECGGPFKRGHERVDVTGYNRRSRKPRVLLEVELRRQTPLANIVKVWKWIKNGELSRNVVVVQAFSKRYSGTDARKVNAELIGKLMQKAVGCRYIFAPLEYSPGKGTKRGGGALRKRAKELAAQILDKLPKRT